MADVISGSPPPEGFVVRDPRLAAVLSDPRARPFLEPFVGRTSSVKAAADAVGCHVDTMLYRVRVFLRVGLLKLAHTQARKGRAIKHYRTVHDAYFVPHELTPFATLEERLYATAEPHTRAWAQAAARRLQQRGTRGTVLYRDRFDVVWSYSAGLPRITDAFDPLKFEDRTRTPGFDAMTTVFLDDTQARRVQTVLLELMASLREPSSAGRAYQIGLFFTPQD
jgi:hypothetical protein